MRRSVGAMASCACLGEAPGVGSSTAGDVADARLDRHQADQFAVQFVQHGFHLAVGQDLPITQPGTVVRQVACTRGRCTGLSKDVKVAVDGVSGLHAHGRVNVCGGSLDCAVAPAMARI